MAGPRLDGETGRLESAYELADVFPHQRSLEQVEKNTVGGCWQSDGLLIRGPEVRILPGASADSTELAELPASRLFSGDDRTQPPCAVGSLHAAHSGHDAPRLPSSAGRSR